MNLNMQKKWNKDHAVGLILFAIGVAMGILSMGIRVRGRSTDPGSRLFPLIACILIAVCGVIVFLTAGKATPKPYVGKAGWLRILIFMAVMVAYLLALKYLGFLISTPFFLFATSTMLAGEKKTSLLGRIIYALVLTAAAYLLFKNALKMSLPVGLIFG